MPRTPAPGGALLPTAAVTASGAALVLALLVAPEDAVQGPAQRLMYVHVPAAWVAYLAFAAVLVCSVAYLVRRDLRFDRCAQAAAELGIGLTALAIGLGMLWGRPVWGVWWTWDARLVTTTVLLLVYVAYLGVRRMADDPHVAARRSAAVGVVAFLNVPVVHFSVVWWRTLHQPPTVLGPEGSPPIDPVMAWALAAGVVAFTLLAVLVVRRRVAGLRAAGAEPAAVPPAAGAAPVITVVPGGGR
ncbi:cytochrome C biogenesis protein [Blastococcus sp. KM273128]|uniref:cytochrome c biogenesis protein CcsA n=1 Tax=Blastococcus sp. KM273128 TaxID=2570314 RepID=UPI001F216FC9|nr:cytochrome c biogenesis protein CcsA [Blastococcus sp. KM273128]MCF6743341.1 cytochrome C biogenesis protein [Blastococcus sp. KM273128]